MTSRILYVKGAVSDLRFIRPEQDHFKRSVAALRASPADVIVVGDAIRGLSRDALQTALAANTDVAAIIVQAHGNITDDRHFIRLSQKEHVWAHDFYADVAQSFRKKPVNIFMFSCGSGSSLRDAQRILPVQSTLVNMTLPDNTNSFGIIPKSLCFGGDNRGNAAEALFLSMLTRGLPTEWGCDPCLTIVGDETSGTNIKEMWNEAKSFCCTFSGDDFPKDVVRDAREFLEPYMSKRKMTAALATMRYFSVEVEKERESFHRPKGVPFVARHTIDSEDFKAEVVHHGLLGPIGAMAYGIYRDDYGAFQRPIIPYVAPQPN